MHKASIVFVPMAWTADGIQVNIEDAGAPTVEALAKAMHAATATSDSTWLDSKVRFLDALDGALKVMCHMVNQVHNDRRNL